MNKGPSWHAAMTFLDRHAPGAYKMLWNSVNCNHYILNVEKLKWKCGLMQLIFARGGLFDIRAGEPPPQLPRISPPKGRLPPTAATNGFLPRARCCRPRAHRAPAGRAL